MAIPKPLPQGFAIRLTKAVKAKLAELSRRQSLTLKATVAGTSLAGQVTSKKLKVKLKGQGPTH